MKRKKEDFPFHELFRRISDAVEVGRIGHEGRWLYGESLGRMAGRNLSESEVHARAMRQILNCRPDLMARAQSLHKPSRVYHTSRFDDVVATIHYLISTNMRSLTQRIRSSLSGEFWP